MRYRTTASAALVALMCAIGACATGRVQTGEGPAEEPPRQRSALAYVEVENLSWSDVVLYVAVSGRPQRLGMVTSARKERFRIPATAGSLPGTVHLIARPIAGTAFQMPDVAVSPGQTVEVTLVNQLSMSTVAVYDR